MYAEHKEGQINYAIQSKKQNVFQCLRRRREEVCIISRWLIRFDYFKEMRPGECG